MVVPSGRVGPRGEHLPETRLYARVARRLAGAGVSTLRFDVPRRADPAVPASPAEVEERTARLLAALPRRAEGASVWLATSLGAQVALRALRDGRVDSADVPLGLVLVGCVLEEPARLPRAVRARHLVYGGEDLVAYSDRRGRLSGPLAPRDYAPRCARLLAAGCRALAEVHVLDGLGHTLEPAGPRAPSAPSAAGLLAALITGILRQPTTRAPSRRRT